MNGLTEVFFDYLKTEVDQDLVRLIDEHDTNLEVILLTQILRDLRRTK